MSNVFLIIFAVILTENFIFESLLGVTPFLKTSEKPRIAISLGLLMTIIMTVSSAAAYASYSYLLVPAGLEHFKTFVFAVIAAVIAELAVLLIKTAAPAIYEPMKPHMPLTLANCAVLGALLISAESQTTFTGWVLFGLASGLGFTLASVIFAGVRVRISLSEPPKAFKGFPLLLVAAGLIALAFSGFYGMKFN